MYRNQLHRFKPHPPPKIRLITTHNLVISSSLLTVSCCAFSYQLKMTRQSCCLAQIGCCFGGHACRTCCRCFPKVYESTSTRLMYVMILFFGTVMMCLAFTPKLDEFIQENITHFDTACNLLNAGDQCRNLVGYKAVYRMAFTIASFFFIMSILTLGVKNSNNWRASFHNGFWIWKFVILISICVGVFYIPDDRFDRFEIVWMWMALIGSIAFILIQLWLLVYFARSLGNIINCRIADGGNRFCWYGVSSLCTLLCYTITIVGVILLLKFFTSWENCMTNKLFIGINASLCFIISVFSVLTCCGRSETHSTLLQSSVLSVYIIYLTWTALSSVPREPTPTPATLTGVNKDGMMGRDLDDLTDQKYYCGPDDATFVYNEFILPYVGIVIMFFTVVYSSIGTSSDNAVALGVNVGARRDSYDESHSSLCSCFSRRNKRVAPLMSKHEDLGGQRVERNEWEGTVYNYSLFHVVFCLASMFIMMTLTGWFRPEESRLTTFSQNWSTVWMKMGSSWACALFYLIALPFRRLGRYGNHQHNRNGLIGSRILQREMLERETVT